MKLKRFEIETSAGKLVAEELADPSAPGIALCLIPKGADFEIDLALAQVKEDKEIQYKEEDKEENVSLYVWENIFSEDWTKRIDYLKKDVDKIIKEEEEFS